MNESYFPWLKEYAVGIRLIDNDHRDLFDTVNELHDIIDGKPDVAKLREITDRLVRYVQEHFEREEHLMAEYSYPGLAKHRRLHHDFVRVIFAIRKIEIESPESLDLEKLAAFLRSWLKRHILKADREYIPYLKGEYGRRKADITVPFSTIKTNQEDGEEEELVTVPVQVPFAAVNTIRRCARLLRLGGDAAQPIEDLTDPIVEISLADALSIAKIVLKES